MLIIETMPFTYYSSLTLVFTRKNWKNEYGAISITTKIRSAFSVQAYWRGRSWESKGPISEKSPTPTPDPPCITLQNISPPCHKSVNLHNLSTMISHWFSHIKLHHLINTSQTQGWYFNLLSLVIYGCETQKDQLWMLNESLARCWWVSTENKTNSTPTPAKCILRWLPPHVLNSTNVSNPCNKCGLIRCISSPFIIICSNFIMLLVFTGFLIEMSQSVSN